MLILRLGSRFPFWTSPINSFARRRAPPNYYIPRAEVICRLSTEQTMARIYHLLPHSGALEKFREDGVQLSYLGARLKPQYRARGCTYDY